jgi:hypothetical protein
VGPRDAAIEQALRRVELGLHLGAQLGQRPRAREVAPVDEHGRGPFHAQALGLRHVGVHALGHARVVERFLEAGQVEAQTAGVAQHRLAPEVLLALEQRVAHHPESALAHRGHRRHRGEAGVGVHGQRVVLEDHAQVVGVELRQLVERGHEPLAVRALVVDEHHDGDGGLLGAEPRIAGVVLGPHPHASDQVVVLAAHVGGEEPRGWIAGRCGSLGRGRERGRFGCRPHVVGATGRVGRWHVGRGLLVARGPRREPQHEHERRETTNRTAEDR